MRPFVHPFRNLPDFIADSVAIIARDFVIYKIGAKLLKKYDMYKFFGTILPIFYHFH